jgi:glycosyltransferase involved in cell wall biosynthesis
MNVLMVTSSYPKFPGDVTAPFIESIAHAVAARGHQVDLLLPQHPELRRGSDEPVRFFPYRYAPHAGWNLWGYAQSLVADEQVRKGVYLLAPLVALRLRRALGERLLAKRYDVVHAHWVVPNAAMIADQVRASRTPFAISLHGSDVFLAEKLGLAKEMARGAFRSAGAVTACSSDLHRRALALGARPERTRTVPYGVDLGAFAPGRPDRSLRRRLGVPDDSLFVLAFGRLVEKKGFRYLIEAAAQVPGIQVVVAGEGDLARELSVLAGDKGAPVSMAGALDRDTMAAALAEADIAVVPSVVDRAGNLDGLPNALLEALAAGRPVVASRLAGIPEVVRDGENGLLVPEKDVPALAAALTRLVREPSLRDRLGRAARRHAETHLSWQAVGAVLEECYVQAAALEPR